MFISVVKNQRRRNNIVYAVFIFLELVFFLIFNSFFIYNLFKRFTFLFVKAENWSLSQRDCFSQDSCAWLQDLGECVSNSVTEAMIMEIKDMYHPALYL